MKTYDIDRYGTLVSSMLPGYRVVISPYERMIVLTVGKERQFSCDVSKAKDSDTVLELARRMAEKASETPITASTVSGNSSNSLQ